jgi:hypothetical protein
MDRVQLDALDADGERRLGPGHRQQSRERLERLTGREQHARAAPAGRLARGVGIAQRAGDRAEPEHRAGRLPERQRPGSDLLQGDHVRLALPERGRLRGQRLDAPRDVPRDQPHHGRKNIRRSCAAPSLPATGRAGRAEALSLCGS